MKCNMLKRRKPLKKIVILPVDFTGALLATTNTSGVVILIILKGKVESYATNIDIGCNNPKEYISKAEKMLENMQMSHLKMYEWEKVEDNFDLLMFVYGGKLTTKMSCVK